jgi:hypothetical protein
VPAAHRHGLGQEPLGGLEVVPDEREPHPRSVEHVAEALHAHVLRPLLAPLRLRRVPAQVARDRAGEERPRIPDAGSGGVRGDAGLRLRLERARVRPGAEQLLELEEDGDPVHPVVRGQDPGDLVMAQRQPPRLAEVAEQDAARDRRVVDVRSVLRVPNLPRSSERRSSQARPRSYSPATKSVTPRASQA